MAASQINSFSWIEVSQSKILSNVKNISHHLSKNIQIMAMVKANAYGHGLTEIAPILSPKVDYFGVQTFTEGLAIRHLGLNNPILVTGPVSPSDFFTASRYNISLGVFSLSYLHSIAYLPLKIHLKINTGMNRLGLDPSEVNLALSIIQKSPLKLEGVYTHFHSSDTSKALTLSQLAGFLPVIKQIKSHYPDVLSHCANSAAIFNFPQTHLDMVRPGIKLFSDALSWKTRVIQSRFLKTGDIVGYSATYRVKNQTYQAIIPVGYSDGLDRKLSNQLSFLGLISMNFTAIKTQSLLPVNSIITLIGPKQSAKNLAQAIKTIEYEVLTRINPDIPRIIVK